MPRKQHLRRFFDLIFRLQGRRAQGTILLEPFYRDLDDRSREWSNRFFDKSEKMPNFVQAGAYSVVTNYLQAVQTTGSDDTGIVMKKFKSMPLDDMFARNGNIQADGRMGGWADGRMGGWADGA